MTAWTSTTELIHLGDLGPKTYSIVGRDHRLHHYIDLLEKWQITFQSLHMLRSSTGSVSESDMRSGLVHASMQYIAQLAAYRDQIHDQYIQSHIRTCESIMMLSHAVFILPHQSISRQIVKWASFHNAPNHDRVSGSVWRSVHKCILGGYITEAIRLVKDQSDAPVDLQSTLISLLKSVPLLDPTNICLTCSQFDQVFDLYRLQCGQFLGQIQQYHISELIPIAKTLHGDVTSILDSVRDLCPDNWLYGLSALLLFSNPTATKSDLGDIVAICIQLQHCEIPYQDCIYQILSGDVSCALVAIYSQIHISWLVAHLADLFYLAGHKISNMIGKQSLRTRFIFEYGCELVSDVNLWHIAPSYLISCCNSGLQLIRSGLLHHIVDEFTAEKAIDLCNRLQLNDDIISICKQMASRSLSRSCPESAVLWELRANDHCAASDILDSMVKQFIQCSGQVPYSSFILEEMIAACKQPPSSLLSLCIAVQIMASRDSEQRLRGAIKFLHRGDVHNHALDVVIATEAARILNEEAELGIHTSISDISMLMTLLYSNESVSTHLNRTLSNLILQSSSVITSQSFVTGDSGCIRSTSMSDLEGRYIWSDNDVCIVTSLVSASIYDINDLTTAIRTLSCPQGRSYSGPVCRLDCDTYMGLCDNTDIMIYIVSTNTWSKKYSATDDIQSYDIHAQYIAILIGRTGHLLVLCRHTFQPISEHNLSERAQSISVSSDASQIAFIDRRPERQIQFFNMRECDHNPDPISLRRVPVSIQYTSNTELLIVQKDEISLWSTSYGSCIWSISCSCIDLSYIASQRCIAILQSHDIIHVQSITHLSTGLASVIATGSHTRLLSGQASPYMSCPDTPEQYLQVVLGRPAHAPLDPHKHHDQILRCLKQRQFPLVADLVRCAPTCIPKSLFNQLLDLNQSELILSLLPTAAVDEEDIVQLLTAIRPDIHGQQLFKCALLLPKTDSVIIRHLLELSNKHVADILSSLTRLLIEDNGDEDVSYIINWICLLIDGHAAIMIHDTHCRNLLHQFIPVIQSMAQTSLMVEKLVCLLSSYQRHNNLYLLSSNMQDVAHFNTDKIETISW